MGPSAQLEIKFSHQGQEWTVVYLEASRLTQEQFLTPHVGPKDTLIVPALLSKYKSSEIISWFGLSQHEICLVFWQKWNNIFFFFVFCNILRKEANQWKGNSKLKNHLKKATTPAPFPCLFLLNPFVNQLLTLNQDVFLISGFNHFLCLRSMNAFLLHHLCASPKKGEFVGNLFGHCHREHGEFVTALTQGWDTPFPAPANIQVYVFKDNSSNQSKLTWIFSIQRWAYAVEALCLSLSVVQSQEVVGYVHKCLCVFLRSVDFSLQEKQEFFNFHLCESARPGFLFILYIQERGTWCCTWSIWISPTWLLIWFHLHNLPWKRSIWPFSSSLYTWSRSDPLRFFSFSTDRQKTCYCRERQQSAGCDGDYADP